MFCRAFGRAILPVAALLGIPCQGQDADPADAAGDWWDRQYGYVASNESLRSLLYDFGTSVDIPVIVSARVSVIVDDRIPVMSARQFLAEVHTRFGVIWVYDGTTLYLYDATEAVSDTVDLPFTTGRDAFQETVDAAGIMGAPLNWVFLPAESSLQLSGPPRFVEWGATVAGQLTEAAGASTFADDESFAIRIFQVEYGYVDQTTNGTAGSAAPIAGLAEMIAKLMNVAHVSGVVGVDRASSASGGVSKLRGTGVIRTEDPPTASAVAASPGVVGRRVAGEEAFVVGDPRLNAVIVRDRVHRIPIYEQLIAELDAPVDQIEIAISVLDIDVSAAEELQFALETESVQVNAGADDGDSIRYLESAFDVDGVGLRIRALRNSANSRILTRPSITTLDNHEASFQNNRTFYVRLGGNDAESVDLAPVSYGWLARIRPHVIYDGDHKKVQLAIHIEDGNRGGAALAVTGVPEVAQNVIQTQAAVREGNSLLIGGYTVREQTRFRQRMPLLGRVPLVGRLFSSHADRDQSIARYFLITPTILPATISYEINSGFDGPPVDGADAVKAVEASASNGALPPVPEPTVPVRHHDAPGPIPAERETRTPATIGSGHPTSVRSPASSPAVSRSCCRGGDGRSTTINLNPTEGVPS